MKQIIDIVETFKVSRPVFRLTFERGGSTISANLSEPVHIYRPQPEEGNYLSELVCGHYNERFDSKDGEFSLNQHDIAVRAMSEVRRSMCTFLERNLEMRNPRQSKIYRWYYRDLPETTHFDNALIMMYKYMRSFSDSDMKATNTEHINNAIALLEAMMEKYDEKR